jgi:hypothetical protein
MGRRVVVVHVRLERGAGSGDSRKAGVDELEMSRGIDLHQDARSAVSRYEPCEVPA